MSAFKFVGTLIIGALLIREALCGDCEDKNTCGECIQAKGCAWCSKVKSEIFSATSRISKCHPSQLISEVCHEKFVDNPKNLMKVIADRPMKNAPEGNSIQIRPQQVVLNLKPGEEFAIDIRFKKAENYPVDLYYLMDFSSSMSKHKNHLSKLGNKLADTMKNLTSDFQLGFGSFVDKVVLPFTSTLPSHLRRPCPRCRSPYSFKNHMSLSRETTRFSVEVEKAQMSGNLDTPEGVFDALMQAIVCREKLNWRDKARHIVVVSTDAPFHLAGDGKLGGVVEPHDGLCYLNEEGDYTHSLVFDYPSVSQINHKALENNMNVIFAVVNKVKNEYLSLSKEIRGASLGLLDAGENIADLIKAQYEKITTTIRLTDNARGPVQIAFSARCKENEQWRNSNECTDIKGGSEIYFKARISVLDCSEEKFRSQEIKIKPVGINETLTVRLEAICECGCSADGHPGTEINSEHCSFSGNLVCGQCVCNEGKIGEKCECSGNDEDILKITDTKSCIPNNETMEICSGRGECRCGQCQCERRQNEKEEITGKFCECDNFSCERRDGFQCSTHGSCRCGKCSCDPGWSGQACECSENILSCVAENEEDVCSGRGTCVCGVCHCRNGTGADEHRYAGKFCQICMTCLQQCDLFNDCVECLSYNTGPFADYQCQNCSLMFRHNLIESLEVIEKNSSGSLCVSADHSGCTFKYIYYYEEDDQLVIWAATNTICPEEVNLFVVVTGTIGGTVLIGLLFLIIWKVLIDIHDKREYEKFERERHLANWGRGENPLFRTAITTYENPTYGETSC